MQLRKYEEMLLSMLGYAINSVELPEELFATASQDDWNRTYKLAVEQGVMAIAWDAVLAMPKEIQPERGLKLRWGIAVEKYTETYRRYCKTIKELSDFYASHGIATVQLKGVGLSTYYPVPERRQGGDIDIYTYSMDRSGMSDEQANKLADDLMKERGIEVENHSYKHSNFYFKGIPIENHKFFTNVSHYTAAAEANGILLEHFKPYPAVLDGKYEIMVPSPEFNSVFIIMHALQHFTSGLALHHICDWACVLKKTSQKLPLEIKDKRFVNAVRAVSQLCRKYLGTDIPAEEGLENLEDIIMKDILAPEFRKGEIPHNPIGILWYKTKRFVYTTNLQSKVWTISSLKALWKSIVSHVLRPETILMRGE